MRQAAEVLIRAPGNTVEGIATLYPIGLRADWPVFGITLAAMARGITAGFHWRLPARAATGQQQHHHGVAAPGQRLAQQHPVQQPAEALPDLLDEADAVGVGHREVHDEMGGPRGRFGIGRYEMSRHIRFSLIVVAVVAILVPAALIISAVTPWAVVPLLMVLQLVPS